MKRRLSGIACVLLASCHPQVSLVSDANIEAIRAAAPGMTEECIRKIRFGGIDHMPRETDQCFKMTEPNRWRGLWRNNFEGSQFCPSPASECGDADDYERTRSQIWLDFAHPLPDKFREEHFGALFVIDFIGRRTAHRGHHGHMGMFENEVIVDRIISMTEMEAPEAK